MELERAIIIVKSCLFPIDLRLYNQNVPGIHVHLQTRLILGPSALRKTEGGR